MAKNDEPLVKLVDVEVALTANHELSWYTFYLVYSDVEDVPRYLAFSCVDRENFSRRVLHTLVNFAASHMVETDQMLCTDWKSQTLQIQADRTLLRMFLAANGTTVNPPVPYLSILL